MNYRKISLILLALLLAGMAMIPMVSAGNAGTPDKAEIEALNAAYQNDTVLATFGTENKEYRGFVDLNEIETNPWYTILRKVNDESDKDLGDYYYPNGPMIGKGTDMKGSLVVMMNKDWIVDKSVIQEIYKRISKRGQENGVENIPCRFISMGLMITESRTDKIRPVFGGMKVHSNGDYATLGFIATDSQGYSGVVTTGHIGNVGLSLYQPDPSISGSLLGSIMSRGNSYSDSSWTRFSNTIPKVYELDNIYPSVYSWRNNPSGYTIYKAGVSTGTTSGSPAYQTNIYSSYYGKYINNQWFATYSSSGGDSGAPVYEKDSEHRVILDGIHMGRSPDNAYAVFSPVGGIRQDLGITPSMG